MKTALCLVVVIAALAYAEEVVEDTQRTEEANTDAAKKSTPPAVGGGLPGDIQQAIAGDLDLKLVSMADGTPRGKCYCSCNLNNQPVFIALDANHLSSDYAVE